MREVLISIGILAVLYVTAHALASSPTIEDCMIYRVETAYGIKWLESSREHIIAAANWCEAQGEWTHD